MKQHEILKMQVHKQQRSKIKANYNCLMNKLLIQSTVKLSPDQNYDQLPDMQSILASFNDAGGSLVEL